MDFSNFRNFAELSILLITSQKSHVSEISVGLLTINLTSYFKTSTAVLVIVHMKDIKEMSKRDKSQLEYTLPHC